MLEKKKKHIGVIQPKIRVRNEISRFLSSGSTARSVLAFLDLTPDSSSCPRQLLESGVKSKRGKREVLELDPPPTEPPYQASSRGPFFSIGRNVQMR